MPYEEFPPLRKGEVLDLLCCGYRDGRPTDEQQCHRLVFFLHLDEHDTSARIRAIHCTQLFFMDLASQMYAVPPATLEHIRAGTTSLLTELPRVGMRTVAKLKGLIVSTWVATVPAAGVRTRAMDEIIASRAAYASQRARRASWGLEVLLSAACIAKLGWWQTNLGRIAHCPIRESPLSVPFNNTTESDASDTVVGAVTFVEAASVAASAFIAALVALAPAGLSRRDVARRARCRSEFMAALPQHLLEASSSLRELCRVDLVIFALSHLLRGGRHKVVMDNLGRVFIMGGVVPSFATGGRE